MLQIRLSRQGSSSENTGGARPSGGDTVTVACPDHLVLADLPVAKSIGTANTATQVKIVGRRSRRHLGERVHFCVRCDFPIAIYGRLSPCSHAFCLDCARSDASCYLCDQRIQKIQTIKMMEGILICAAPHCLKSFMKKSDFETHLHEYHSHLLQPHAEKEDGNESDAVNVTRPSSIDAHAKQSAPADSSTARAPPRTVISPSSNSQPHDLEDKSRRNQPREQPPTKPPIVQPKPPAFYPRPQQHENNTPPVFDRSGPYNRFHNQHSGDMQGGQLDRRDSDQFLGKQHQGNLAESPFRDYPLHSHPPPSFIVPVTPNPGLVPPFNYSPFPPEGAQSFYNASYEIVRQDMTSAGGSDPSSLLGFPSTPSGGTGIREGYPQPWNMGLAGLPFEQMQLSQGVAEGFASQLDSQGRTAFFQGDYQRVPGMLPLQPPLMPAMVGKALEPLQSGSASDNKDGIAGLTPDTMSLPPPPPPPPHFSQLAPQGNFPHSGDTGRDRQNYGWQIENLDGFRGDRSREK